MIEQKYLGWCIDLAAMHDRRRRMIDGLMELHRGKLQARGGELPGGAGRERRRCLQATGLEEEQHVGGGPAGVSHHLGFVQIKEPCNASSRRSAQIPGSAGAARETGTQGGDGRGKATPCAGRVNMGGVHRG